MDFLQAIVLGIVQGLTEYIPVSSTAHLIFASRWIELYKDNPQQAEQTTATIAVIQLGTLLAVLIYFASDIFSISVAFLRDHWALLTRRRGMRFSGTGGVRPIWLSDEAWLGWLIILGSIPVGVVGLLFKKVIEGETTKNLWIIAMMMIVIALLLAVAEFFGSQRKELKEFGIFDALVQGFAQVLALMPGSSRSGSTIMGGLLAGEKREAAARFSFLLSIPAITASGLLELKEALKILDRDSLAQLFVGTIIAGVVGYLSIWFLLRFLKNHTTAVFIIYRIVVGGIILGLLYAGILSPQVSIK